MISARLGFYLWVLCHAGVSLSACGTVRPTPPPTPAQACAGTACTCADVCSHGDALACGWAKPTAGGATCLTVCRNANDPAGFIRWDLGCRAHSATCDESACP